VARPYIAPTLVAQIDILRLICAAPTRRGISERALARRRVAHPLVFADFATNEGAPSLRTLQGWVSRRRQPGVFAGISSNRYLHSQRLKDYKWHT
jgi:hypothetical protein